MTELRLQRVSIMREHKLIVRDVSLTLRCGEMLALIGPNGGGKSTLLKAIAQLLPHAGEVHCDGRQLQHLGARERAQQIAYLGQEHAWSWSVSVAELVALGRYPHQSRWRGLSPSDWAAVERVLAQTELLSLAGRSFDQLSGGERARALLARALAVEAPILLTDEPVTSLDPHHQLRMMALLRRHSEEGHAVIAVLHDLTLASRFCHRLALMAQGAIVATGSVGEVLTPENLRDIYGVSALRGEHQQQSYVLPWRYHDTDQPVALGDESSANPIESDSRSTGRERT